MKKMRYEGRSWVRLLYIGFTPSDNNQVWPTAAQVNEKFARVFAQTAAWLLSARCLQSEVRRNYTKGAVSLRLLRTAMARRISSEHKPFATTEEMQAITGLERQSLRLWVRRGLLPKPGYFSDGKHGVRSRWPRSALDRARFVMAMRAQGHTLDEIVWMIREKWPENVDDGQPPA